VGGSVALYPAFCANCFSFSNKDKSPAASRSEVLLGGKTVSDDPLREAVSFPHIITDNNHALILPRQYHKIQKEYGIIK
jgi:hypothetical protein